MSDPQLPATIVIGAHVFTLDMSEEARQLLEEDGSRGDTRSDRTLIRVANTLSPTIQAEVVVHEALHGAWAQTSLRQRYDHEQQEEIVTALAPLVLALVRANPALVAFLVAT